MSDELWGVIASTTGHFHLPDLTTVHPGAVCSRCLLFQAAQARVVTAEVTKVDHETATITVTFAPKPKP